MDKDKRNETSEKTKDDSKTKIEVDDELKSRIQEDIKPDPELESRIPFEETKEKSHKFIDE
jgi:hypothetical protein